MNIWTFIGSFSGWVVALLIAGIVLLVVEMLQPGIGVPGAIGLISIIAAIVLQANTLAQALIMVAMLVVMVGILFLIFARSFYKGKLFSSRLALEDKPDIEQQSKYLDYIGRKGAALTMLRPVGTGKFGDEYLEVTSENQFIDKGTEIVIVETDGIRIIVREITHEQ